MKRKYFYITFFLFVIHLSKTFCQELEDNFVHLKVEVDTGHYLTMQVDCKVLGPETIPSSLYLSCYTVNTESKLTAHESIRYSPSLFKVGKIVDSNTNVILLVAYDTINGKLIKYDVVRLPGLIDPYDKRGFNSMALIYSGRDAGVTKIKRDPILQTLYRDSNYLSFDPKTAPFNIGIDYYVHKKDTVSLLSHITKIIDNDGFAEYEYDYAAHFANVFLKNQILLEKINSKKVNKYGQEKTKYREQFTNAISINESSKMIAIFNELQREIQGNEEFSFLEDSFRKAIARTLAREGKPPIVINSWLPINESPYIGWRTKIDHLKILENNSSDNYEIMFEEIESINKAILAEIAALNFKPIYLFPFQYRQNLALMRQTLFELISRLAIKYLPVKDAIHLHNSLLNEFSDNEILQTNCFNLLILSFNADTAFQILESITGKGKVNKDFFNIYTEPDTARADDMPTDPFIGRNIREFTFINHENEAVCFDSISSSGIVIDFWATWCVPCIQSMPSMNELKAEHLNTNIRFMMANIFERKSFEDATSFIAKKGISNAELLFVPDAQPFSDLGLNAIPFLLFVNKDGIIVGVHKGFDADNPKQFKRDIRKAISHILPE